MLTELPGPYAKATITIVVMPKMIETAMMNKLFRWFLVMVSPRWPITLHNNTTSKGTAQSWATTEKKYTSWWRLPLKWDGTMQRVRMT